MRLYLQAKVVHEIKTIYLKFGTQMLLSIHILNKTLHADFLPDCINLLYTDDNDCVFVEIMDKIGIHNLRDYGLRCNLKIILILLI